MRNAQNILSRKPDLYMEPDVWLNQGVEYRSVTLRK